MKRDIFKILLTICSAAMLLIASPLQAISDGTYQIEVMCFENLNTPKEQIAEWPSYVGSIDTRKAIKLNADSTIIKSVFASGRALNRDIKIIQTSTNHKFIMADGWKQALKEQVRSTPIYFVGGEMLNNKPEVEGLVSVKLIKNLFHTNLDIIFRKIENGKVREFRLTQSARLKPKESYYFDHELFGVFVIVSPANS
jgi:hypothetical protein